MNAAGMRSVASRCTDTATIATTDSAKVGKVIRSGMRCTCRSITETVTRQAVSSSRGASTHVSPYCTASSANAATVTTSTQSQREGSAPSGERPARRIHGCAGTPSHDCGAVTSPSRGPRSGTLSGTRSMSTLLTAPTRTPSTADPATTSACTGSRWVPR